MLLIAAAHERGLLPTFETALARVSCRSRFAPGPQHRDLSPDARAHFALSGGCRLAS
ncbi:MAG TPA: hypothetical protein VIY29_02160 [Ktedonobacteraceae bacterium]